MLVAAGGVDDEDVAAEVGGFAVGFFGEAEDVVGAGAWLSVSSLPS